MTRLSLTPLTHNRPSLLSREFDSLFDSFFDGFTPFAGQTAMTSLVNWDVTETDSAYVLHADMPGVNKEDLDITLNDGLLTVKGEKTRSQEHDNGRMHVSERSYGSFSRSLSLPNDVDADKVDVTLRDGVLTISLPKQAEAQQKARKLNIK